MLCDRNPNCHKPLSQVMRTAKISQTSTPHSSVTAQPITTAGRPPTMPNGISIARSGWSWRIPRFWPTVLSVEPMVQCLVCLSSVCPSSVCNVLYCGKTVRPSQKVSEGVNRKPGSKSSFFWSPPYFYFRFRRYGPLDGRFLPYVLWLNGTS